MCNIRSDHFLGTAQKKHLAPALSLPMAHWSGVPEPLEAGCKNWMSEFHMAELTPSFLAAVRRQSWLPAEVMPLSEKPTVPLTNMSFSSLETDNVHPA